MKKLLPRVIDIIYEHQTNDPLELAKKLNFKVIYKNLKPFGVRGATLKAFKIQYIFLDDSLPSSVRNVVLAHELGHIYLHGVLNKAIEFHALTQQEKDELEFQANKFAFLLISHTCLRNNPQMIDGIRYEEDLTVEGVVELLNIFERTVCFVDAGAYI